MFTLFLNSNFPLFQKKRRSFIKKKFMVFSNHFKEETIYLYAIIICFVGVLGGTNHRHQKNPNHFPNMKMVRIFCLLLIKYIRTEKQRKPGRVIALSVCVNYKAIISFIILIKQFKTFSII